MSFAVLALSLVAASPSPNVVFLLADDQRPDTIRALGNPHIETPHLDALVRDGVTFTRATCAYPLCVPSRWEMLTGRVSIPHFAAGARPPPPDEVAWWPAVMQSAGYRTVYVGKWHTQGRPSQRGYLETDGLFAGGQKPPESPGGLRPSARHLVDHRGRPVTGYVGWMFQSDDGVLQPENGVGLTLDISAEFADAAIRLLERAATSDQPFFLHVNFTAPHDPRLFPTGYERRYDPATLPLPKNFRPEHPFDHGNARGRDEVLLPFPRTEEEVRSELACYYAVITHLDAQIGRIRDALRRLKLEGNTIVIYAADHGLALGSHGLVGKQNMYEHTIGVPLVISGPGVPRGARQSTPCYLRDLFPTVCELAGIPVPQNVQGRSFAAALTGKAAETLPFIVGYFQDSQRMIRSERWKLVMYPKLYREQLFDVIADPDELHDLSTEPSLEGTRFELRKQLVEWLRDHGDPVTAPE